MALRPIILWDLNSCQYAYLVVQFSTLTTLPQKTIIMQYSIEIQAKPTYIPGQSSPDRGRYVFAYTITMKNTGDIAARLMTRHWIITNANGEVQEVRGDGVIGDQPYLRPGQSYQYSSGSIMPTPVGSMRGSYQMVADDGTHFDAEIPMFTLAVPGSLN